MTQPATTHSLAAVLPSTESSLRSPPRGPATTTRSTRTASAALADYIWAHMGVAFPHRWTSAMGDDPRGPAGRAWATALAGMTREQIDAGLEACRHRADGWPPALGEFQAMCLGVPTLARVEIEIARAAPEDRLPFTLLVWQLLDVHAFRIAPAKESRRLLAEAYELAREHVMRGGDLPEKPAAAIAHEPRPQWTPPTAEERAATLARVRAEVGA